ncbi:MAG: PUR family DNA/RNA-binding protein [Saprospiraceae bacterium]|nr:PUR family DNA/RNA-binding protein [Saprospiraceae bacterium]HMW38626.1 DUF3276 family protein [Saprospiraceae bacterium]HMX86889.1 DUF3276 family protein [Saprospiraceae bacterium]HMZ39003.1 DUF3276 family protein [Saprospiraceae bacterium]HNA64817.1 DUF3276 family protein [Saprospiraceae bacterium]
MDKNIEIVYSNKMRAGRKRTYFFDVKKTKGSDFYISISESTRKLNGEGYDKHMIFLYKEDFNRFVECLQQAVNEVKTNLLPDFDYDAFTHREPLQDRTDGDSDLPDENSMSW